MSAATRPNPEVRLAPFARKHARQIWTWKNTPEVACHLPQESVTLAQIEGYAVVNPDAKIRHYIVETVVNSEPVGYVTLSNAYDHERSFWWSSFEIVIGPEHQGFGYGRATMELIPGELKRLWETDVIIFAVYADNTRALRLYEDLDYEEVEQMWLWRGAARKRTVMMSNKPYLFKKNKIGFTS